MSDGNKISPFQEYKLRLRADKINGYDKFPTLAVNVHKNNVSITAYPGNKGEDGRTVSIKAGLDALSFSAVCVAIEDAIVAEPGWKKPVRCYTPRKRNPGETGTPKLLGATVVVGKDKDGCVYISVVQKNPPHVKFLFVPSEYHEILNGEGQLAPLPEVTVLYARAWLAIMRPLVAHVLATDVHDWREEANNNGGGNNNYNRGNNNGGGNNYNRGGNNGGGNSGGGNGYVDNSFDDDLPM